MITTSFSVLLLFGSRGFSGYHTSGGGHGGGNGSSMGYVNPDLAAFIAAVFLLFLAWLVYKVRRSLKNDSKTQRTKQQEEADAFRELYEDNFGKDSE